MPEINNGRKEKKDARMPDNTMPTRPVISPSLRVDEPERTDGKPWDSFGADQAAKMAKITRRQALDDDRLRVACSLVNVFNYAVQVQGKRDQWIVDDYRAFVDALSALDGIGMRAIEEEETKRVEDEIRQRFNQ